MSRVVLNPAALQRLYTSPSGPIAKDLTRRAIRVESQAKMNASGRPGPRVRTGRLRASITHRLVVVGNEVWAEVGTNVHYAIYLELGTDRMRPYPFLRPALIAAQ